MRKRKQFSREFKKEAVRLLEEDKKSGADLARELGTKRNQLYKWKETMETHGEGDPEPYIPEKRNKRGRHFTRYRTDAKRYFLVATRTLGKKPETKISLSNTAETTEWKRLAWMQLQLYWIERAFEEGKSECGMADYQVRKWSSWHHHMALVMMAMLFMLRERIRHKDTYPLLSCSDIEELHSHFLPRRDVAEAEVIRQLEDRHHRRLSAIESHTRKQRKRATAEWLN